MNEFYVTLPSNVSSFDYFQDNTIGNYKTKLASRIQLSDEWEIGLAEISYTKSWFNINEDTKITLENHYEKKILTNPYWVLRKGVYDDILTFLGKLNQIIQRGSDKHEGMRTHHSFTLNPLSREVVLNPYKEKNIYYYPRIVGDAGKMLGISDIYDQLENPIGIKTLKWLRDMRSKNTDSFIDLSGLDLSAPMRSGQQIKGNKPVDMSGGFHSLFVYCDLIEPNHVGDSLTKLLKVVNIPSNEKYGNQIVIKYDTPYYHKVKKKEFETIEIDIKDDSGQTVPFKFGRSICTLHFRKR